MKHVPGSAGDLSSGMETSTQIIMDTNEEQQF